MGYVSSTNRSTGLAALCCPAALPSHPYPLPKTICEHRELCFPRCRGQRFQPRETSREGPCGCHEGSVAQAVYLRNHPSTTDCRCQRICLVERALGPLGAYGAFGGETRVSIPKYPYQELLLGDGDKTVFWNDKV